MGQGTVGTAYRFWFAVRSGDGTARTGIAGSITVTVRNPGNTASDTPAVTEFGGGLYFFDISGTFTTTHGVGEYGGTIDVTAAPRDLRSFSVVFFARNPDDLAQPGDAMDLVTDAVDAAAVATSGAQEIRDEILSDATPFAGANVDATISSRESEASAAARAATDQLEHDTTQLALAGLNDISITDVQTALTNQGYTAARAPNLDNLDVAVSTRAQPGDAMDLVADAVDAASLATSAVDEIADGVLDEVLAGHVTPGTAGAALEGLLAAVVAADLSAAAGSSSTEVRTGATQADDFYNEMVLIVVNSAGVAARRITDYANTNGAFTVSPALPFTPAVSDRVVVLGRLASAAIDTAAISTAVWSEVLPGAFGADSAGERLASTDDAVGTNLDATVSSRESEASAAARAATDQLEHDTTQLAVAGLNDLSQADVQSALTAQGYTAARAPNLDNLDATVSSRAIPGDAMALTTGERAQVVDDVWDEPIAGHLAAGSTGEALDDASAASGAPTAAQIADAVWDEVLSGHLTPGTAGAKLDATLDDVAAIVAAIQAATVDGTVSLNLVLSRLNAFVRGRITLTAAGGGDQDAAYFDEADTGTLFTNRKSNTTRTPQ